MLAPTGLLATIDPERTDAVLFDVMVSRRNGWVTVAVIGELDLASAPRVRTAVAAAVADGGTRLVLDLGGVDFIDSTGLGVVLGAVRRVRSAGGSIRLVVREPAVLKVFELTGLDQVLPILPSVDEAVAPASAVALSAERDESADG